MSPLLFWSTVLVLSLVLGALLPKILHFLLRITCFVAVLLLIVWLFAKAGITPDTFQQKIASLFSRATHETSSPRAIPRSIPKKSSRMYETKESF